MKPACRDLINCRFFLHLKNQKVFLIYNYLHIQLLISFLKHFSYGDDTYILNAIFLNLLNVSTICIHVYYNAILDIFYMIKFYQFIKIDYIVEVIIG